LPRIRCCAWAGAIEAEQARGRTPAAAAGTTSAADGFAEQQFSGDAQRWWATGKPGDKLVLHLRSRPPVAIAWRWRSAAPTTTASADVGSTAAGSVRRSTSMPGTSRPGALLLGDTAALAAGTARLEFTITGKNDKALPAHMVGIDYVLLEAVR